MISDQRQQLFFDLQSILCRQLLCQLAYGVGWYHAGFRQGRGRVCIAQDKGQGLCGAAGGALADVGVVFAHHGVAVAGQFHQDGLRSSRLCVHGNEAVAQGMKAGFRDRPALFDFRTRYDPAFLEVLLDLFAHGRLIVDIELGHFRHDERSLPLQAGEVIAQDGGNPDDDGLSSSARFVGDASDDPPVYIHFSPFQAGAIAQAQAGEGSQHEKSSPFARGILNDGSQLLNG